MFYMSQDSIDRILKKLLDRPDQILNSPTPEPLLKTFEEKIGYSLPPLLRQILLRSNGGEWCFGRFELEPYIHSDIASWSSKEVWEDLAEHNSLKDCPEILSGRWLPVCSDYGAGIYCLDYRQTPPSVLFVAFGTTDGTGEQVNRDFSEFVEEALEDE